jgi:hypothetical protein
MTVQLAPLAIQRFFDNNNNPLVGGQLYTYQAGTTTPAATYADSTGNTANPNPVPLNARGECSVWLSPNQSYKFVLCDSNGNVIWTQDQITTLPPVSGTVRPTPGVIGQSFFDQNLGQPIWCQSISPLVWVNAAGATV